MEENQQEIETMRYTINLTKYLKMLRERLHFAEPGVITKIWTASLAAKLGPQNAEDKKMKENMKKKQSEQDKQKVTGQLDKLKQ